MGFAGPLNRIGPQGPQGLSGSVWLNGNGEPDNNLGNNNDYYLDDLTADVYEKVNDVWLWKLNLKGPKGAKGATGSIGPQGPAGFSMMSSPVDSGGDEVLKAVIANFDIFENVELEIPLLAYTQKIHIRARKNSRLRIAFKPTETNSNYISTGLGGDFIESSLETLSNVYVQCNRDTVLEVIYYI
jgi:hypothetical protein